MTRTFILLILLSPSIALANPTSKIVGQLYIEHKAITYQQNIIETNLGFRVEKDLDRDTIVYFVPGLKLGKNKLWNIGPQLRFPVYGSKKYKVLLQAELNMP